MVVKELTNNDKNVLVYYQFYYIIIILIYYILLYLFKNSVLTFYQSTSTLPVSLSFSARSSCKRIKGFLCPRCAIQTWERVVIKGGWMCGWNWDWDLSDLQTRQRHGQRGRGCLMDRFLWRSKRTWSTFSTVPNCPICLCQSKIQMCECKKGVHFEEHFAEKHKWWSLRTATSSKREIHMQCESTRKALLMINILALIKGTTCGILPSISHHYINLEIPV